MARIKISTYVTPDVADTLKRVATRVDRSMSDLIEEAVARSIAGAEHDAEHAALIARLEALNRRLGLIEKAGERQLELIVQAARFFLCVAPEIPPEDHDTATARGSERLRALLGVVATRLETGRTTWRDAQLGREAGLPQAGHQAGHQGGPQMEAAE